MKELYPFVRKMYDNNLVRLKTLKLRNSKLINQFVEHLWAKGNKLLRVNKLLGQMLTLEKYFAKDLSKVTAKDVEKVMGIINKEKYSDSTKKDYWRLNHNIAV